MPSDICSWARTIERYEEIPEVFKKYYNENFPNLDSFLMGICAPADRWGSKRTNEKLILLYDDKVIFFERIKNKVEAILYPIQNISYIENGSILLYSWIKISGIVNGETKSFVVEYNTVVDDMFKAVIDKLRTSLCNMEVLSGKKESYSFDCLCAINFKFMNYAKRAILNGEEVINFLYQPEIKVPYLKFFRKVKCSSHMIIYTDKELIILKEEDINSTKTTKYGGIWIYIPINKVLNVSVDETEDGYLNLNITVYGSEVFKLVFECSQKEDLEKLINQISKNL